VLVVRDEIGASGRTFVSNEARWCTIVVGVAAIGRVPRLLAPLLNHGCVCVCVSSTIPYGAESK
jgi:hypothetical protein